jgi:hypothetical protein
VEPSLSLPSLFPHFCITVPVAVNLPSSLLHFFGINEQQLIPQPELAMLFVKSWTPHGTTLLPGSHYQGFNDPYLGGAFLLTVGFINRPY